MIFSNIAMIIICALIIKCVVMGYRTGISGRLIHAIGLILGVLLSPLFVPAITYLIKRFTTMDTFIKEMTAGFTSSMNFGSINTTSERVNRAYEHIASMLASDFAGVLLRLLAFVIGYALIMAVLAVLFSVRDIADRITIIDVADRVGGAVFGILQALLICWGVCTLLMLVSGTTAGSFVVNILLKIPVFNYLYVYNPLLAFL